MQRAVVLLAVLLIAACAAAMARGLQFRGAAKPGVHVLGVDVGGRSREQIVRDLRGWSRGRVTIRAAGRTYHVPRGWLVSIDTAETAERALSAGSELAPVLPNRVDVAPGVRRPGEAGSRASRVARGACGAL